MTNNKGLSVVLDDKRGIVIKSSGDILAQADGDVEVRSGKEMRVTGDKGVFIRQGDNRMEVRDGIRQVGRRIEQR